ncbi:MAG: uracil-DNA glycosylase family protein [bacterium]
MPNTSHVCELARGYFEQQTKLYGNDFLLGLDVRALAGIETRQGTHSLEDFYRQIKDCEQCRLAANRTKLVFGTGNPNAHLMCVGEAPGYEEDQAGIPFVGAAGQLLNKILAAIGFAREEVYIANIVKCRPPGNRNPVPDEAEECMPYLKAQIKMIQPKLILALGKVAAQNLIGRDDSISRLRGSVHSFENIKVLVTYHPAALLRNPQWKRDTWADVRQLRALYDKEVGDKPKFEPK